MWAQWLSGRALDSRLKGHGFESHRGHCVVSFSKTHLSLLSTGSTPEDLSGHNWQIVDMDVRIKSNKRKTVYDSRKACVFDYNLFLFLNQNMLWVLKRTVSSSFEHPKHMFILMSKKIITILRSVFFFYLHWPIDYSMFYEANFIVGWYSGGSQYNRPFTAYVWWFSCQIPSG